MSKRMLEMGLKPISTSTSQSVVINYKLNRSVLDDDHYASSWCRCGFRVILFHHAASYYFSLIHCNVMRIICDHIYLTKHVARQADRVIACGIGHSKLYLFE